MRFERRPPLILVHDDKPGQCATLYAPNGYAFLFRGDACAFDDKLRSYTWAFEGVVKEGDRIVFSTTDREVPGIVKEGVIVVESGGAPAPALHDGEFPPVDLLLAPPHPAPRERPIAMARPKS